MIIDSSALISILRQESDAMEMSNAIAEANIKLMGAHSYLETCMVIAGPRDASAVQPIDGFIREAGIQLIPFTAAAAMIAVQAFIKYGKGRHPAGLNFGDC
ncbi:MAG: type II toxin-antitoxin system VapC family toxin, partial [Aestuariivirga sp.]